MSDEPDDAVHILDPLRSGGTLCGGFPGSRATVRMTGPLPDRWAGCWMCLERAAEVASEAFRDVNTNEGSSMSLTEAGTREAIDEIHRQEGTGPETVPSSGLMEFPPGTAADPEQEAPLDEIVVSGTAQLSMFDLGGKKADSSSLKFTGGKVKLADGTAFKKGETVVVRVVAVVNSVTQKDEHDVQTGQVVSCEQRHEARITDMVIEG